MDPKESEIMPTLKEQIMFISRGSMVRRFHQHVQLLPDTDARHSHGVAMFCVLLCQGNPTKELLMAALTHDLGEQTWGDVPAPTKRAMRGGSFDLDAKEAETLLANGFENDLTDGERRTLKLADALDGMLACCRELAIGNRTLVWIYNKWLVWLSEDFAPLTDREQEVLRAVDAVWKNASDRPDAGYLDNSATREAVIAKG
jgi:5'-deoxynucleotidase YfbR-like HD superfamily hydrolase